MPASDNIMDSTVPKTTPIAEEIPTMNPLSEEVHDAAKFLSRNTRQKTFINVLIQNYHI